MGSGAVTGTCSLLLMLWSISFGLRHCHLACLAIKIQRQTLAVIDEEQWTAARGIVMSRAHIELVSDAGFRAHEFRPRQM